jgi:predicted Zn-ribbon and HTH transcriptional regulator
MLHERVFAAREFFETRQGVCRLMPPLPKALAEMSPRFAMLAAPVVEQVAKRLAEGHGAEPQSLTIPTLLTQGNRSAGRDSVRVKPKREKQRELTVPQACKACGVVLKRQDRDHCGDCMPEELRASAMAFRVAERARLEVMRGAGEDPAHSEVANERRGKKVAQAQREFHAWDAEHGGEPDPELFRREILPSLQNMSLGAMARATGLSEGYCSFVRRGIKVPHQRHWETLRRLKH